MGRGPPRKVPEAASEDEEMAENAEKGPKAETSEKPVGKDAKGVLNDTKDVAAKEEKVVKGVTKVDAVISGNPSPK